MPRGSLSKRLLHRIQKLSPLCTTSLSLPPPVAPVPRGVSGGAAALSSLFRRPFLRRNNEAHLAAEPPERSFFFPLFLSPRKKKRLLTATRSQNLCQKSKSDSKPSPRGEGKGGIVPRGSLSKQAFAPNTETFSAVHNISVAAATGRTHSPGGLGGRSRLEFIISPPLPAAT